MANASTVISEPSGYQDLRVLHDAHWSVGAVLHVLESAITLNYFCGPLCVLSSGILHPALDGAHL